MWRLVFESAVTSVRFLLFFGRRREEEVKEEEEEDKKEGVIHSINRFSK